MIRFVDLTPFYWTLGGKPCCAFLSTVTDTFIVNDLGGHTFDGPEDIETIDPEDRVRCAALVPTGFWEANEVDALRATRDRIDADLADLADLVATLPNVRR